MEHVLEGCADRDRVIEELRRELGAVGIRGRLRRRILTEAEDHIRSDPDAAGRFGSPREVANAFAAELGARASRRAAVSAFLALGVAGAVYAVSFVGASFAGRPPLDTWPLLAVLVFPVIIVAPQVSFVAGVLALARSLRRREPVLPTAELKVINRRSAVALVGGLATMGGFALFAFALRSELAAWWLLATFVGTAAASALLLLALVPAAGAVRLHPQVAGQAGDVFDDLGFGRTDPWRFARRTALGAGLAVWLAAAVQGDLLDGAIQGTAEALACLAGFAAFGRFLGLRR
jgi:hypothetical protein